MKTEVMPRIFIVDDEAPARRRLTTLLADIAADCPHVLVGEADDPQRALDGIAATQADLVLLDVQMPGMSGIELAAHLAVSGPNPPAVIFVTAYDEYAVKAFEVHALDYLLKPVRATRLAEAILRADAMRTLATPPNPTRPAMTAGQSALQARRQHFSVQERGRLLLVPIAEVLYLKAELKYVTLRTKDREYLIEASLQSLEDELSVSFVRVHRNALVARHAILGLERGSQGIDGEHESDKGVDAWQVILRGIDDRVPVSRRQSALVKSLVR